MENKLKDLFSGKSKSAYNIAEIGINHNGDLSLAKSLIKIARDKGFDAVKFQKRVPELCVPKNKRDQKRITPWGEITYFEYKEKIEFGKEHYDKIESYCKKLGIAWSASPWDVESIKFLDQYDLPFIKVPSDKTTDLSFIKALKGNKAPIILSTGGTNFDEIAEALSHLEGQEVCLLQCTSIYPCPTDKVNLKVMDELRERFKKIVGFSSHHTSPLVTAMAVAYGAKVTEVHVTLDRAMWGTDQAMSLEPRGMEVMITTIKDFEIALGSGAKEISESEKIILSRTIGR